MADGDAADYSAIAELLTPASLAILDAMPEYRDSTVLHLSAQLRAQGHSAALVSQLLTQSKLRLKAREKCGPFADRMLLTAHGLEQATRLEVAAHHAQRFREAGITSVADLGCGIGVDAIAKAALGIDVIGVDMDPVTVAFATHNLAPFPNARIEWGRAEDFRIDRSAGLWCDPARRNSPNAGKHRRIHDPEQASPPLSFIVARARELGAMRSRENASSRFGPVGAKLAPALAHEHLVAGTETQWVSWRGQVLEACMYFGPLARAGVARSALVCTPNTHGDVNAHQLLPHCEDDHDVRTPHVGDIEDVVWEPDAAVIRAGLLGSIAHHLGAHTIDPSIAYLSNSSVMPTPFARAYRVREVLPFTVKKIAAHLRSQGIGVLEVKKRGADIDPATLRQQLKLDKKAVGHATLIITRARGQRVALVCEALQPGAGTRGQSYT